MNDIATGADGKVYVPDTGIKFGARTAPSPPAPTPSTSSKRVTRKRSPRARISAVRTALLSTDKGVVVVTFGSGEVYRLDDKGNERTCRSLPTGALDVASCRSEIPSW